MNRFTTLISALVLTASGAWADAYFVKNTSDGYLNVRSGPGTSYDVMRRIYPGDNVTSLEQKGRWLRVRLPSGGTGWVSRNFLTEIVSFSGDIRLVKQTNDGFLNLRGGPGTGYGVVRRMYPGDQVKVLSVKGNWVRVRTANGAKGWAYGAYLE